MAVTSCCDIRSFLAYAARALAFFTLMASPCYADRVADLNTRLNQAGARWRAAENWVTRLRSEDHQKLLLNRPLAPATEALALAVPETFAAEALPGSLDWRNKDGKNFVTPARNQMQYGSCWAYATVGAAESHLLRVNPALTPASLDLSEQVLLACSAALTLPAAFSLLRESGLPAEGCYPYVAGPGNCADACANWEQQALKTGYFGTIPRPTLETLKSALLNYGPFYTEMVVDSDFGFYESGVYSSTSTAWLRGWHAVLLVGYDDEPDCGRSSCGYFIAKNSWGSDWGENGFFKIAYGEMAYPIRFGSNAGVIIGDCNITVDAAEISIDHNGGLKSTAVTTAPSQLCPWSVSGDPSTAIPWIFFKEYGNGAGNGVVSYDIMPNLDTAPRSGTVTVAGKSLTIRQSARPKHNLFFYWQGSGWGELVIDALWQGRHHTTICDTRGSASGLFFCGESFLEGTDITLIPRGLDGTSFKGWAGWGGTTLPCQPDPLNGHCSFRLGGPHYIEAHFSGVTPPQSTAGPTATHTPAPGMKSVRLLKPNGGERLKPGAKLKISWSGAKNGAYRLELLKKSRRVAVLATAAKTDKRGRGSLVWTIPGKMKAGADYFLRVADRKKKALFDISDGPFVIGKTALKPTAVPTAAPTQAGGNPPQATPTTVPPYVPPTALPTATPVVYNTTSASIALIGLGQAVYTTSQSDVTLWGIAEASSGIKTILCTNVSSNSTFAAAATARWSGPMLLMPGDNKVSCTVTGFDGAAATIDTVLTYHPASSFNSAFTLSQSIAFLNEPRTVLAQVALSRQATQTQPAVRLLLTDRDGQELGNVGNMRDDGVSPDAYHDGTYTGSFSLNAPSEGYYCYRAEVSASGQLYRSEVKCVYATTHFSAEDYAQAFSLADWARQEVDIRIAQGVSHDTAAAAVAGELESNPNVGAAGHNGLGGVWWITKAGILGGYEARREDYKSGGGRQPSVGAVVRRGADIRPGGTCAQGRQNAAESAGRIYTGGFPAAAPLCPAEPAKLRSILPSPLLGGISSAAASDPANEIQSTKALMLSPYIKNRRWQNSNFGGSDDYYGAWRVIFNQGQCQLIPAKSLRNDSTRLLDEVTLNSFSNLTEYGYIHFSTHGINFYNGLFNKWKNEWGFKDNSWKAKYSLVGLDTGRIMPPNSEILYEEDLKAKRIALMADRTIILLPGYFETYLGELPNSLVVLSSCYSMNNTSLASAFLGKGAGAVIGFTMPVKSGFATNTTKAIVEQLYGGKTLKEAHAEAVRVYGEHDINQPPAYLKMAGKENLKLNQGGVANPTFADGKFTGWLPADGPQVLQEFDGVYAYDNFMAALSNGGYEGKTSSHISQTFCVPAGAARLSFMWRYLSEEFPENPYNDTFIISICETDVRTGAIAPDCWQTGLSWGHQTVDLTGAVAPGEPLHEGNDVYQTDWARQNLDITPWAGKSIHVEIAMYDLPGTTGDSVLMVDDFKIE